MKTIALLSCVSKKCDFRCEAKNMYKSPLFIKSYNYVKSLKVDDIYILSAKYGLLECTDIIEPYDITLKTFDRQELLNWTSMVVSSLKQKTSLMEDNFIILAGDIYCRNLLTHIKNYTLPLKGLSIGKRLKWLKEHTKEKYLLFE